MLHGWVVLTMLGVSLGNPDSVIGLLLLASVTSLSLFFVRRRRRRRASLIAGALADEFLRPNDPVWKFVTFEIAPLFQKWFLEMVRTAELGRFYTTNSIDDITADLMSQIASRAHAESGLHPAILLILAHQFVDADVMMRQLQKDIWVIFMLRRPEWTPQPEAYVQYLSERFFDGRELMVSKR